MTDYIFFLMSRWLLPMFAYADHVHLVWDHPDGMGLLQIMSSGHVVIQVRTATLVRSTWSRFWQAHVQRAPLDTVCWPAAHASELW